MEKRLTIEGMHCMHCAGSVQKAVAALGGSAEVSLEDKTALVKSAADIPDEALLKAIGAKGFQVLRIERL